MKVVRSPMQPTKFAIEYIIPSVSTVLLTNISFLSYNADTRADCFQTRQRNNGAYVVRCARSRRYAGIVSGITVRCYV